MGSGLKIVTIVGARPQFIKAAAVSRELRPRHREVLVHTGQHYDFSMSGVFFDGLELPAPDVNLGVGSGSHGAQTGSMLATVQHRAPAALRSSNSNPKRTRTGPSPD